MRGLGVEFGARGGVSGMQALDHVPEARRVVHHAQVRDLVRHDVVDHVRRRLHQPPIQPHFAPRAKHVIHTVSPIYSQHSENEVWRLLSSCYRNTLDLAHGHKANSIAFPSLGTGIYGIPIARACKVAIEEAEAHIAKRRPPHRIIFCCFSDQDAAIYRAELERRNG